MNYSFDVSWYFIGLTNKLFVNLTFYGLIYFTTEQDNQIMRLNKFQLLLREKKIIMFKSIDSFC